MTIARNTAETARPSFGGTPDPGEVSPGPPMPGSSLSDNPGAAAEPRWFFRPWLLALAGVTFGYPLSLPFVLWFVASYASPKVADFVVLLYLPVSLLMDHVPFIQAFFEWYFEVLGIVI